MCNATSSCHPTRLQAVAMLLYAIVCMLIRVLMPRLETTERRILEALTIINVHCGINVIKLRCLFLQQKVGSEETEARDSVSHASTSCLMPGCKISLSYLYRLMQDCKACRTCKTGLLREANPWHCAWAGEIIAQVTCIASLSPRLRPKPLFASIMKP